MNATTSAYRIIRSVARMDGPAWIELDHGRTYVRIGSAKYGPYPLRECCRVSTFTNLGWQLAGASAPALAANGITAA